MICGLGLPLIVIRIEDEGEGEGKVVEYDRGGAGPVVPEA